MKTRYVIVAIAAALFSIATVAPPSYAGSATQHRIEGAVIGIGAVILGQALLDNHRHHQPEVHAVAVHRAHPRHYHRPAGYWESRREWVPAQYEKVWNPGHYSRRGNWVPGHWTRIMSEEGYWHTERVWVPYR